MNGGSLGIRSGSYGSLDKPQQLQQQQNGGSNHLLPIQSTVRTKPAKMFKEKDRFFHWTRKSVGRRKVGMLMLCVISAAVFFWVLYVGKGEDAQESDQVPNMSISPNISATVRKQNTTTLVFPPPSLILEACH